jgi:hypothetical protein
MYGKWQKRDSGKDIWWTPAVLTDANKDDNPIFTQIESKDIFRLLVDYNFIYPTTEIVMVENKPTAISAWRVNPKQEKEWVRFMDDTTAWSLYVLPFLVWVTRSVKHPLSIAFWAFVAAHFFSKILEDAGDDIYHCIFGK